MTDIAPLGFGIDTSGLQRGKAAAVEFAASVGRAADATDKMAARVAAAAKIEYDAAKRTADLAKAKFDVALANEKVQGRELLAAQALAQTTGKAVLAAKAHLDLANAEKAVADAAGSQAKAMSGMSALMQGVTREAAAMATTMGLGGGVGGRLGAAAAFGAARGAADRLTPVLGMLNSTMGRLAIGATASVAGYTALAATLADNQDRWASYQQQLANSLGSQSEAQKGLNQVVGIANEVGISVDTALQSFNRFARVKDDIGASTDELVLMTETIMKLGRAGGTETGAMQGAMMQLSQALGSGRLNGDELRSIMENMTPLVKAIADGLNVSVGALKRMGAEGELTSDKIFKALLSQAGKADEMFRTMPKTVEQSKQRLSNQFDELASHLGKLVGASEWMRRNFDYLATPIKFLNDTFEKLSADGITKVESHLEKLAEKYKALLPKPSVVEQFNKDFNKDQAKATELEKQRNDALQKRADAIKAVAIAQTQLQAAEARMRVSQPDIAALTAIGNRGIAFRKAVNPSLAALGGDMHKEWTDKLAVAQQDVTDFTNGIAALDRQAAALKRNDPFEKLVGDAEDLQKALVGNVGGMVDMNLQAQEISRTTGQSIERVMGALRQLEVLRAGRDIEGKVRGAGFQRQLANDLASGKDRTSAEAAAEAAQWAFDKFGDTVDSNTDIVRRYTSALTEMKLALQAVSDASELTRLKTQLEELTGVIATLSGGGGTFAERLSRHQSGIAAFRAERGGASGTVGMTVTAQANGGGLPGDIVSFFQNKGLSLAQAQGIAAGIMSESSGNHMALNRSSGAFGLGQWLGPRQQGLIRRYGVNPGRQQQLEYLWSELNGGDAGGPSVLRQGSAADTAAAYIGNFMRPGKDTASGTARALGYLGGGTATIGGGGVDFSGQIISGRNNLFNAQEQERFVRMTAGLSNQNAANSEMISALQSGSPEKVRLAELQLKVIQAQQDFAPEYSQQVDDAVRDADASERRLKAEQQIFDMKQANDNQARRNGAIASGDPAQMRALDLQLRIEEIRRNAPAGKQGGLIAEATRDDALKTQEAAARLTGEYANQIRQTQEQFKLVGLIGEEERIQTKLVETRNQLYAAGIPLNSDLAASLLTQAETLERMNILLDEQRQRWEFIKDWSRTLFGDIGKAGAQAFGELTRTGEVKWKSLIGSMEEAFYSALDRMVEKFIISPIVNFLVQGATNLLGSLFGGNNLMTNNGSTAPITWTANGRAFNNGEPMPFAGGGLGIFNAPTRFMGGRGLAGEGPGVYEGIFPLRRGADGRMGITAHGAGSSGQTTVNIIDQRGAGAEQIEVQERETGDGMRKIDIMVRDSVKGHMRRGSFDADQRANYGVPRMVNRR